MQPRITSRPSPTRESFAAIHAEFVARAARLKRYGAKSSDRKIAQGVLD
jgi:hypothetical protein